MLHSFHSSCRGGASKTSSIFRPAKLESGAEAQCTVSEDMSMSRKDNFLRQKEMSTKRSL